MPQSPLEDPDLRGGRFSATTRLHKTMALVFLRRRSRLAGGGCRARACHALHELEHSGQREHGTKPLRSPTMFLQRRFAGALVPALMQGKYTQAPANARGALGRSTWPHKSLMAPHSLPRPPTHTHPAPLTARACKARARRRLWTARGEWVLRRYRRISTHLVPIRPAVGHAGAALRSCGSEAPQSGASESGPSSQKGPACKQTEL